MLIPERYQYVFADKVDPDQTASRGNMIEYTLSASKMRLSK